MGYVFGSEFSFENDVVERRAVMPREYASFREFAEVCENFRRGRAAVRADIFFVVAVNGFGGFFDGYGRDNKAVKRLYRSVFARFNRRNLYRAVVVEIEPRRFEVVNNDVSFRVSVRQRFVIIA